MNILYLNMHEGNTLGGSSLSLYNLLRSLPADCHPIVIVQQRGVVFDYFANKDIEVWDIPSQVNYCGDGYGLKYYASWPIRYVRDNAVRKRFIHQVTKRCNGRTISVVHSNSATIDVGNDLAQQLNARHIWHLREFVGPDAPFKPFLPFSNLKAALRKADHTLCITHAIAKHYDVEDWTRNLTLFDAVGRKEDICQYGKERKKYFLFCGGENPVKRPDWAIKAFCKFYREHPEYQLHIVGPQDQAYHEQLLAMIPDDIRQAITFEGFTDQLPRYMAECTGLLMCTEFEAMGRVTVEAQLRSCPVIGAASGGTLELIENEHSGLLFHTIDECASCMSRLVSDISFARSLAEKALVFAQENFLEESYGDRIYQLYINEKGNRF